MKKSLLFIFMLICTLTLQAQKDTVNYSTDGLRRHALAEASDANINIYPVPVRENRFTIKSDKEISNVKITNIIGQDIFRAKYNNPLTLINIVLENPQRGMYLVTMIFSDNSRIVKKIMIEPSE